MKKPTVSDMLKALPSWREFHPLLVRCNNVDMLRECLAVEVTHSPRPFIVERIYLRLAKVRAAEERANLRRKPYHILPYYR